MTNSQIHRLLKINTVVKLHSWKRSARKTNRKINLKKKHRNQKWWWMLIKKMKWTMMTCMMVVVKAIIMMEVMTGRILTKMMAMSHQVEHRGMANKVRTQMEGSEKLLRRVHNSWFLKTDSRLISNRKRMSHRPSRRSQLFLEHHGD